MVSCVDCVSCDEVWFHGELCGLFEWSWMHGGGEVVWVSCEMVRCE